MTGPSVRSWDSAVFLDPRLETRDGHHGHAIDAALREVLGETYGVPRDQHRSAQRKLIVGPGTLVTPPGGLVLQSIRHLDIELDHATIVGRGDIPAVLAMDGSAYGRITGTGTIQGERAAGGRRLDVPADVVVVRKSIEGHHAPNQTHFRFNGKIGGLWRNAGYRGGLPGYTTAQEDHFKSDEIQVFGNYDVMQAEGDADLCKVGVWAGNQAWSNNRRHKYGYVHVAWCETAVRTERTGVDVDYLVADGCRDVWIFGGAVTKNIIRGGEAEVCARFINDGAWQAHDHSLMVRDFYAKLDAWRPGLGGIAGKYNQSACAIWGSRGNCILENVTVGSLPVKRGANGVLYYAPRKPDGTQTMTNLPAPKFWSAQSIANILTRHCSAHGYRAGTGYNEFFAFEPEGHGISRHELWKNTEPDGVCLGTEMAIIEQRK
jgi:hypothetical protein